MGAEGATVNAADPVEIEVEAVDERGDVKGVRLSVDDQLVQRKVSFPFRMRWQPSASDVGQTETLVVEAEDKAGNVTTSTRTINVGAADALEESPLPTGVTTIAGRPVLGETPAAMSRAAALGTAARDSRLGERRIGRLRRQPAADSVVDAAPASRSGPLSVEL